MPVRLAVVGAGWWSQGWHLPHLSRHEKAVVAAIVEPSSNIRSSLNPKMEQLDALGLRYGAPTVRRLPFAASIAREPVRAFFARGSLLRLTSCSPPVSPSTASSSARRTTRTSTSA